MDTGHAAGDRPPAVPPPPPLEIALPSGAIPRYAYAFDGAGHVAKKDWDLTGGDGGGFTWYHVDLPRCSGAASLLPNARALIGLLCPPLTLHDILSLAGNGPHCSSSAAGDGDDGAVTFRVNAPGPVASSFALRLAARVSERCVVTVSVGRVPRLGFDSPKATLFRDIPSLADGDNSVGSSTSNGDAGSVMIDERFLELLLAANNTEASTDNPVPRTVSGLLVHIIDTHVNHVHDIVAGLEMELDAIELHLEKGGYLLKKQVLEDRRIPKMHLDLQRILQVVSHGEQVFPRVKEKCSSKSWFASKDIAALEEIIGRVRRLKENLGFITSRVAALQAGLDGWQSEQINRKLYYLSFLSIIFLPLSIVTGVFGMNVGGVPWTDQKNPALKDGFINVLLICGVILLLLLLCFLFPSLYVHIIAWRTRRKMQGSSYHSKKRSKLSFLRGYNRGDYMRL